MTDPMTPEAGGFAEGGGAHAPKPWRLDGSVVRGQSAAGHERPICEIYREVRTTKETLANAAVILAAPDMYEALMAVWTYFHKEPGLMYGPFHPSHAVGEALAKASPGETP
jgi:hypothetical protein